MELIENYDFRASKVEPNAGDGEVRATEELIACHRVPIEAGSQGKRARVRDAKAFKRETGSPGRSDTGAISGSASHADENSNAVAVNYRTRTQGVQAAIPEALPSVLDREPDLRDGR